MKNLLITAAALSVLSLSAVRAEDIVAAPATPIVAPAAVTTAAATETKTVESKTVVTTPEKVEKKVEKKVHHVKKDATEKHEAAPAFTK